MTPEERFELIETTLVSVAKNLDTFSKGMIEAQKQTTANLASLTESITRYVDASDARMKRMEENLDGLIRAITAEHANGKKK
jgi:hypothetical protein